MTKRMILAGLLVLGVLLGSATAALAVPPASQPSDRELQQAVEKVLREHPELVLEVLRNNSEVVLEVAQQGNMLRKRKALLAQWQEDLKVPKTVPLAGGFIRGNPIAPVKIISYSDFTCGYCRQANAALAPLLAKYGDDVMYVFKPLPKESASDSAVLALYSVSAFLQNAEKGWRFYDALFAQPDIFAKGGEAALRALADEVGLDSKKLVNKRASDILASVRKEADSLDVHGTPYFFINNLVVYGAIPKDLFEEGILLALKKAKK